jgi:outer membrane autotransporter protein
LSLVGLNLQIDGKSVPLQQLGSLAKTVLGSGASADERKRDDPDAVSPDDLLGKRFGVWLRGNYSLGGKDNSVADHGFDADQWGVMAGVDYRFSPRNVFGLAVGYGQSNVAFNPVGAGHLDTRAFTAAIYATMYSSNGFYVDAIGNYLRSDYDSQRHIMFTEGGSPLDVTAIGATQGATGGFAFTLGYDINFGAFTIAPSLGYNYLSSTVNPFREQGAAGLDLAFRQQNYSSGTGNAGLRLTYAWKTSVAVVVPQIRAEYLREFIDDTEAFGVRFANDPFGDTPVMIVHTDATDQSYWRIAAGVSAQFRYGISGFIEYQKLQSLQYFDYADVALGVRFETAFH